MYIYIYIYICIYTREVSSDFSRDRRRASVAAATTCPGCPSSTYVAERFTQLSQQ